MGKRITTLVFLGGLWATAVWAQDAERDSIKMKIIATNPSKEETQYVPIRETIPVGLSRREDILVVPPELEVQFDSKTSLFYVVAKEIEDDKGEKTRKIKLEPGEIRLFVVELKDVWYIPDPDMDGLEKQAEIAMGILEGTEYERKARELADNIIGNFRNIKAFQSNDAIRRKEYIAGYWNSTQKLKRARESIEEMERYIRLQREKSSEVMKTDDDMPLPSKTATWLVIFIILVFLGILTGAFYFVWQRRAHLLEEPLSEAQRAAFPESGAGSGGEDEGT